MHSARLPAGSLTGIGLPRMLLSRRFPVRARCDCVIAFSSGHFIMQPIVVPVPLVVLTGIFLFIRF